MDVEIFILFKSVQFAVATDKQIIELVVLI